MFLLLQAGLDQLRFEQAENIDCEYFDEIAMAMQSLDNELIQNQ